MSFEYASNTSYQELAEAFEGADRVAITTHQGADGDALGSVLALARIRHGRGRHADVYLVGPPDPPPLLELADPTPVTCQDEPRPGDDYDLIVVTDTGAWSQLEVLGPWLRRHRERVIGFDHHRRGDDVAARRIVNASAASATQVLLPLVDELGVHLDGEVGGVAEALFMGLATDTGWFRFENADAAAMAAAARLLAAGVDKTRIYRAAEESFRPERLRLAARALASVCYLAGGAVALMRLTSADFQETGGSLQDLGGLVNLPMGVSTVRVSILLTQQNGGRTKLSLRSKPALPEEAEALQRLIDVNELAHHFGGGGHKHAAGARVDRDVEAVAGEVVELVEESDDTR